MLTLTSLWHHGCFSWMSGLIELRSLAISHLHSENSGLEMEFSHDVSLCRHHHDTLTCGYHKHPVATSLYVTVSS
jgi:hypothetical protein